MQPTEPPKETHHHPAPHPHTVQIEVDSQKREIPSGCRQVADLKARLSIPADYELEAVEHGKFQPLADNAEICIEGHEKFVSHVKAGSSS
jgi:hypothetical protein